MFRLKLKARIAVPVVCVLVSVAVFAGPAYASEAFGVEGFADSLSEGQAPVTLAGAHPAELTTTFTFNHEVEQEAEEVAGEGPVPIKVDAPSTPQSVEVNLPRGVVVDPQAPARRCAEEQLQAFSCPNGAAVGVLQAYTAGFPYRVAAPLYDMVVPAGSPGQFAANIVGLGYIVTIDGRLRSDGDYGLSGQVRNIIRSFPVYAFTATFWGDPSDPSHDPERGVCGNSTRTEKEEGGHLSGCSLEPSEVSDTPFLTMPSSCPGQPLVSSSVVESWAEPEVPVRAVSSSPALTGCGGLEFEPEIEAQPETQAADSPTGLAFSLRVPQEDKLSARASANLKNVKVTLPEGLVVNPSSADGLEGCSEAQIGLQPPADEKQTITLRAPLAEDFTLEFEGQSTGAIAADASGASVQQALEGVPGVGAGDVEVSEASGGYEVKFTGALAAREVPLLGGEVLDNSSQVLDVQGTGGTFDRCPTKVTAPRACRFTPPPRLLLRV